ncbi:YchJ family metal-binding protein [Salinicola sp. RZ23]|uniref:YchJ family protein n=1 Tax=Salinicola sp. RZ23 TaxID=1949087 RepID=UPI0018E534A9|nr:YchJ family metal-binding protein [Salinicola sp. RZ23]
MSQTMPPATSPCPCGSGRNYADCCQPHHLGETLPATPEALMRSRYSAFALGNLGYYLYHTWDPDTRDKALTPELLDQRDCDWLGLEIIESSARGSQGTVTFKAYYRPLNPAPGAKQAMLHERSRFRRRQGRWRYLDGEIDPAPASASPQRNAPCPCGSGKKAKRCCHP